MEVFLIQYSADFIGKSHSIFPFQISSSENDKIIFFFIILLADWLQHSFFCCCFAYSHAYIKTKHKSINQKWTKKIWKKKLFFHPEERMKKNFVLFSHTESFQSIFSKESERERDFRVEWGWKKPKNYYYNIFFVISGVNCTHLYHKMFAGSIIFSVNIRIGMCGKIFSIFQSGLKDRPFLLKIFIFPLPDLQNDFNLIKVLGQRPQKLLNVMKKPEFIKKN